MGPILWRLRQKDPEFKNSLASYQALGKAKPQWETLSQAGAVSEMVNDITRR